MAEAEQGQCGRDSIQQQGPVLLSHPKSFPAAHAAPPGVSSPALTKGRHFLQGEVERIQEMRGVSRNLETGVSNRCPSGTVVALRAGRAHGEVPRGSPRTAVYRPRQPSPTATALPRHAVCCPHARQGC